jgi:hypothetical protein
MHTYNLVHNFTLVFIYLLLYNAFGKSLCTYGTQQQHTSTATSILPTKSRNRSLSAQRLSERIVI